MAVPSSPGGGAARDRAATPPAGATAERLAARGPIALVHRRDALHRLAAETFDLLVIGGGITGAGVAREAALRGLRVALVERSDYAAGTSSRSSRLIHGGVRYLEHGHLGLVFEASRERRLLLELAPHLVRPLAFTWPTYRGDRVPRWKVRAGLALYDVLALFRNVARHHALSVDGVIEEEPGLTRDGLVGGVHYWDAATDDTRLTLAAAIAAREAGAVVANHCEVVGGVHDGERLCGVALHDRVGDERLEARAAVVVNATGPWSDATVRLTGIDAPAAVLGAAGAHVAVPRHRLGLHDAVTMLAPDGRVMFVLPAGVHAIIGTTERPASRGPDGVRATAAEVSYLLHAVNLRFPNAQLSPDDVVAAWSGIRPLAAPAGGAGRDTGSASREHAVHVAPNGLVSVTGGKLTTWRAMAADVVDRATGTHAGRVRDDASRTTPLPGGDLVSLPQAEHEAAETTHDHAVGERLARAYGSRWRNVWSYAQRDPSLGRRLVDDLPYLVAEVTHAVEREDAMTFGDVLVRRTHVAFETIDHGVAAAERIAPLMAALLAWTPERTRRELDAYRAEVARLFTIDSPEGPLDTARSGRAGPAAAEAAIADVRPDASAAEPGETVSRPRGRRLRGSSPAPRS